MCSLDQVTVANLSDQEALDDFLNSSGAELHTASSLTSGRLTCTSSRKLQAGCHRTCMYKNSVHVKQRVRIIPEAS